jgi:hypothetical protein
MADLNSMALAGADVSPEATQPLVARDRAPGGWRTLQALVGLGYLFLFWDIYDRYLSVVWGYTGLYHRPMTAWETAFIVVSVGVVSFLMPRQLGRPSAVVAWFLYAFAYVPTIAMTFMIGSRASIAYVPSLLALTFAMTMVMLVAQWRIPPSARPAVPPDGTVMAVLLAGAAVLFVILAYTYRGILSFASIEDVYVQRFAASEVGGGLIGYCRTYFPYVFAQGLVALGLVVKRFRLLIIPGLASFLLAYMIDASKIALIIPVAMFAVYAAVVLGRATSMLATLSLAIMSAICSLLTSHTALVRLIADLVLLRSIAIPGQTFAQYADLFTARGYTYWSNVRGVNALVPPPAAFAHDPSWPVLGQIVGVEFYGFESRMNANANLFAGEGVAAAGPVGVIVIGVLLLVWLRVFDLAARGWDRTFVVLIAVPLSLSLTNVHLSTLLLSFGGAFWPAFLAFYKPNARHPGLPRYAGAGR